MQPRRPFRLMRLVLIILALVLIAGGTWMAKNQAASTKSGSHLESQSAISASKSDRGSSESENTPSRSEVNEHLARFEKICRAWEATRADDPRGRLVELVGLEGLVEQLTLGEVRALINRLETSEIEWTTLNLSYLLYEHWGSLEPVAARRAALFRDDDSSPAPIRTRPVFAGWAKTDWEAAWTQFVADLDNPEIKVPTQVLARQSTPGEMVAILTKRDPAAAWAVLESWAAGGDGLSLNPKPEGERWFQDWVFEQIVNAYYRTLPVGEDWEAEAARVEGLRSESGWEFTVEDLAIRWMQIDPDAGYRWHFEMSGSERGDSRTRDYLLSAWVEADPEVAIARSVELARSGRNPQLVDHFVRLLTDDEVPERLDSLQRLHDLHSSPEERAAYMIWLAHGLRDGRLNPFALPEVDRDPDAAGVNGGGTSMVTMRALLDHSNATPALREDVEEILRARFGEHYSEPEVLPLVTHRMAQGISGESGSQSGE